MCQATIDAPVTISGNTRVNLDYSGWWVASINNVTAPKFTCQGNLSPINGDGVLGSNSTGNRSGCPDLN